jgi:hypothetical protein
MRNVEIDWSISDDDAELPALPESDSDQSPTLNWRRLGFILAALVVLLGVGALLARVVQAFVDDGERRLEASLRDAVALEIAAIQADDRELFLSLQDASDGGWLSAQGSVFDGFDPLGTMPRQLLSLEMLGDQAWVAVHLTAADGRDVQTTWAYRQIDGQWRHTPLDASWWGARTIFESATVRIIHFARDEALAHELMGQSLHWLSQSCIDFGCNGLPVVTIDITNTLSLPPEVMWVGPDLLSFPSPHNGWGRPGGQPPEGAVEELARQLIRKAVYARAGLDEYGPALVPGAGLPQVTLAEQAAAWEASKWSIGSAPPASNYVAELAAQYGPSAVRDLIAGLGKADSLEGALTSTLDRSFFALTHEPDFFLFLLNAEAEAVRRRDKETFQALQDPNISGWTRLQLNRYDRGEAWWAMEGEIVNRFRRPSPRDHFVIVRTRLTGPRGTIERMEGFRFANNRWLHTWPAWETWGQRIEAEIALFRIVYYERDAEFVRPLLPRLDDLYRRISADLRRRAPADRLTITISPTALGFTGLPEIVMPSPWAAGLPSPEEGSAYLLRQIVALITHSLAWDDLPGELALSQEAALSALVEWEVRSVLGEPLLDAEARAALAQARETSLLPLPILWSTPVVVRPSFGQPETLGWPLARAEWLTLLDFLIRQEEHDVSALLSHLPAADSMEDWLQRSVGMSLADVDSGWQALLPTY